MYSNNSFNLTSAQTKLFLVIKESVKVCLDWVLIGFDIKQLAIDSRRQLNPLTL